ncbi:dihydroxyacetone kinase subunit DhaL [Dellaglioa algida]|uniref:dihydroxyacetone kinase subunit DhaL n=1 Tax=Dellaglioa algida TaxID=105612 RepID=UPI0024C49378|nr:dihydroxyacetone kinase subunit DhaL [Dellaglioa algida]MDK1726644.1 dihydroxyacetone kinase subunit DhaL [Dellaglioa algida]
MLTIENTTKWFQLFSDKIIENKDYLSELDTPIGDGDHGNNMARGAEAIQELLKNQQFDTLSDLFKNVAMAFIKSVGGASGPLYGTAFIEMSKASKETSNPTELVATGLDGIKRRGASDVGAKTMIDVWTPVLEELKAGQLTIEKINADVEATKALVATKGRASYLGERSIGHIDPGSMSSGYLFETLLETGALE